MFKIESYLTPIILNHVAKYVKDIRPQDAQLSLWQGEVSFQNLDLRLDVLEQELGLPFNLISGHIHELNIRVPWTKITSEPIKITINTIEFVMKMKKIPDASGSSANSSPHHRDADQKRGSKQEELQQQQQGGLINKIIHNIVLNCHNIIFKYVEDDIVVSMNVQLLSFSSANGCWKPSMVDVNPGKVLIRKLVKISDLTICLDKRNEAGEIDVCQEPVLYRCTLECRILIKYNIKTKDTTSTTRIGLFTQALDVNISSLQFPMIMRLFQIILSHSDSKPKVICSYDSNEEEFLEPENSSEISESYLSWAWNMLPSFGLDSCEEDQVQETESPGHTKDFGIYVEHLNFTLKNSEFINDSIMGAPKRLRYQPIVRISLGGIYFEMVRSVERSWSSVKAGLTSVVVEPLGAYRSDGVTTNALIECSLFDIGHSFIDKSLFDDQCLIADKGWGVTNYEEYSTRITDEYLLFRSPILAFDLVQYQDARDDAENTKITDSSDNNHVQYRLLSSGLTFRYNQALLQVKNIINDYIDSYDYPAYHADGKIEATSGSSTKLHPPLMEDFDALMQNIPLCTFRFNLTKINFEIYAQVDPPPEAGQKTTTHRRLPNNLKYVLPHVLLNFDQMEGQLTTPLNPDKLVHTTCQLPNKPNELLDACYKNYTVNIRNFVIALKHRPSKSLNKILSIPKVNLNFSSLLKPTLWQTMDEVPVSKLDVDCEQITIEFSKRELITTNRLLQCISSHQPHLMWAIVMQEGRQHEYEEKIKLQNSFMNFRILLRKYHDYSIWNASLKSLLSEILYPSPFDAKRHEFLSTSMQPHNNQQKWLEFQAQIPNESENNDSGIKTVIAFWLEKFIVSIDMQFLNFLKYQEDDSMFEKESSSLETENFPQVVQSQATSSAVFLASSTQSLPQQLVRRSSRNSLVSERNTRKISHPEETIHFSSDRDEKIGGIVTASSTKQSNSTNESYLTQLQLIKNLIVYIEIAQSEVCFAESLQKNDIVKTNSECSKIKLPHVLIKSAHADQIVRSNMQQKVALPSLSHKDTSNWTFTLSDFLMLNYSQSGVENILIPIQTTITIALTHKMEISREQKGTDDVAANLNDHRKSPNQVKLQNVLQQPLTNVEQGAPTLKDEHFQRSKSADSISVDGRSNASVIDSHETPVVDISEAITSARGKDIITLTLHADTTPIHLVCSTKKLKTLQCNLKFLLRVYSFLYPYSSKFTKQSDVSNIEIITAAEENASIKEFLDLETNSESSKLSEPVASNKLTASLFCQWTITKIKFELESSENQQQTRLLLELEDLLSTFDKHDDYTKYTSKVGQFNMRFLQLNLNGEWYVNECLNIKMLTENGSSSPFLNIIVTCVGLKNFFKRIGAKRKGDINRQISEICINMQTMQIILDLDRLSELIEPLCFMFESDDMNKAIQDDKNKQHEVVQQNLTSAQLPMLHLDSKGFILYFPVKTRKECCSVAIFKIDNIKITPNLENPLQRNPIRTDVFSKASQLGILGTPGSIIEDRQYELTLRNISVATGDWQAILMRMRDQTNNFHRTNPAFEWNNQNRKTSPQLSDLFNNFTFHCIFAPCIVYNNILICGQALEFNCASDFIASLTTFQINLINCFILEIINISDIIAGNCRIEEKCSQLAAAKSMSDSNNETENNSMTSYYSIPSLQSSFHMFQRQNSWEKNKRNRPLDASVSLSGNIFDSIDENNEHNMTLAADSGFYSCISTSGSNLRANSSERFYSITSSGSQLIQERLEYQKSIPTPIVRRLTPKTISLVTGKFIIKIFNIDKEQRCIPLIALTISQPSFMVTQNIHDVTTQLTLFDFYVNLANWDQDSLKPPIHENLAKLTELSEKSGIELFPNTVLESKQGKPSLTGIPPPLLTYKSHLSKNHFLEIDIEVSKPISCILAEKYLAQLCKHYILINEVLLENPCFEIRSKKAVIRGSKNKLVRQQFFGADRLHCKLYSFEIKYFNTADYNCKLVCADLKANIKFLSRPEKANAKLLLGALYLIVDQKMVVHPIGMRASAELVTEPWYSLPLITANARFNVVQIDIGVQEMLKIRYALAAFSSISEQLLGEYQRFLRNRPTEKPDENMKREELLPIKCQVIGKSKDPKRNKTKRKQREEFYQDDLRAGAFQFVEMMTDSFLPLPYQIQIIKKNFGIICWRYPQPRKMSKIQIFPVPMAVSNPIHIKCRMEYFSETHESFLHFCDFWLSETVSKQIVLPERAICANTWRVVIMQSLVSINGDCFDTSEEDEEHQSITTIKIDDVLRNERKESEFILHPKVLVGCMRIDTSFQSESVPKVQLLVSSKMIKLNLLNQVEQNAELPKLLSDYKLAKSTQMSQTFLTLRVEGFNVFLSHLSPNNYIISSDMTFNIKCIDYGFLNMVYLLEESTLHCYFHANHQKHQILANVVVDKIRINFGPSLIHSLLSSKMYWEEFLDSNSQRKRNAFIPKFVVVNQTFSHIAFGQSGSIERIQLQPKEVHMYSFRSDCFNQELTFFIADDETRITEASQPVPITLKFEGCVNIQNIRVGNKCLVIKLQKLSATQIYVLIKGQFELISMVPHDFRIEIRHEGKQYDERNTLEYVIVQKSRCSFFRSVQSSSNVIMRLKFMSGKGKGRSGDIPLKTNKNLPWLVKVPLQNNNFISFWVRILREEIPDLSTDQFKPQKVLITIWPIFEICSMLTSVADAEESFTAAQFDLAPEGGRFLLDVPATHLTEHTIKFNYRFPLDPKSQSEFVFSLKSIDWNKFFWYDEEIWRIEHAILELAKSDTAIWPLDDAEELRIKRLSHTRAETSIIYNCTASREFSCSLCLEVSPWGLFINSTGMAVSVCDYETKSRLAIKSNEIEMLLAINTAFTIEIQKGGKWIASLPIYFEDTCNFATDKYYVALENISSEIVILCGNEVLKFVLDFKIENGRNNFILRSKYNVTNFTKLKLCILPFALDHKESSARAEIKTLDAQVPKKIIMPVKSSKNCIGVTLDSFFDLNARKSLRSSDTAFVSFVCIKICEESDFSIPIQLTMQFTRKCFSLQNGCESIALLVTLIEKNGIFYLSIFDDPAPAILLSNQTDIKLVVAQTSASENSKVSNTTPEYDGKHFVWYQLVEPFSKCYYTPPEMYANFPDVESTMCNLTLALWNENSNKKTISWSKPIRTDKTWEKFLHVPNHGDVKVIICDKHNIIRVSIYYISQQLEFSVKDIRSRLLTPPSPPQPPLVDMVNSNSNTSITTLLNPPMEPTIKAAPSLKCVHFRDDMKTVKTEIKLRFFIKEINFNLKTDCKDLDYLKTEILALCMDECMFAYDADYDRRQLNVLFANMQIDNQLFSSGNYDFPVILCAQELYKRNPILPQLHFLDRLYNDMRSKEPILAFCVLFFDDELKISSLECKISPIRAYIEDAYVNDLLDALVECVPSNCVYQAETDLERFTLNAGQMLLPSKIAAQSICMAEPMKLQSFRIQPLNLLLSVHTSVRLYIALDHSPLSFSSYERQQILTVPLRFGQSLGMHYLSGAIFGAGWVVGSLEILGSPSGLARSFSTGLRDFVSMPVRGLFRGPWGFVVGVTQGSASLLRNVTAGTVNSMTKLASSVARNLDRLSLDQDHIDRTDALRRSRPQGFTEGFSQGVTGLGISILGAVGGIARHTLEARTPTQVVTGMGKGLVGAVTKPLSGAAELLALTGQGVLQSVGFNAMPHQRTLAVSYNVAVEPSDYRIWKLLPGVLTSDQILFYQEVTLVVHDQLKRAYVFLTSAIFAIIETKWDKIAFILPVDKVELSMDPHDKTLVYVCVARERGENEEDQSYTKQRIMTFLRASFHSSSNPAMTTDSLNDLLQTPGQIESVRTNLGWAFYINEHLGEYLIEYLKIMHKKH